MNLKTKSENLNFYKTELKKTELLLEINKKIAERPIKKNGSLSTS